MPSLGGVSMQVKVKSNVKEVNAWTKTIYKKQIPFATAMAINETLGIGKSNRNRGLDKVLSQQMKQKLDNPKAQTTKAFYRISANKNRLVGTLGFQDWAAKFMKFQIEGGVRTKAKKIGVPMKDNPALNAQGNIKGLKSSGYIKNKKQKIMTINGTKGVWEVHKDRTLKLMVAFKDSVSYSAKFPFYKIAAGYVNNRFDKNLTKQFNKAVKSAK